MVYNLRKNRQVCSASLRTLVSVRALSLASHLKKAAGLQGKCSPLDSPGLHLVVGVSEAQAEL